jgi:hypothetical protein
LRSVYLVDLYRQELSDGRAVTHRARLLNLPFEIPRVHAGKALLTMDAFAAALEAGNDFNGVHCADSMAMLAVRLWHSWRVLLPHYRHNRHRSRWRFCESQLSERRLATIEALPEEPPSRDAVHRGEVSRWWIAN